MEAMTIHMDIHNDDLITQLSPGTTTMPPTAVRQWWPDQDSTTYPVGPGMALPVNNYLPTSLTPAGPGLLPSRAAAAGRRSRRDGLLLLPYCSRLGPTRGEWAMALPFGIGPKG